MKSDIEEWREEVFEQFNQPIDEVLLTINDKHYVLRNVTVKTEIGPLATADEDIEEVTVEFDYAPKPRAWTSRFKFKVQRDEIDS